MSIVGGGQTSYSIDIPKALVVGAFADESPRDIISAIAMENVPYGVAVSAAAGSTFERMKGMLPVLDTAKILGITVADHNRAQRPEFDGPTYEQGETLGLMRQGRVIVKAESDVTFGAPVFFRHVAKAGCSLGGLTSVDDAETAELVGATFKSEAVAGEFVVVELELK